MVDFILRFIQRSGLAIGIILGGGSFLVGGMKTYEHLTYLPTQAKVTGLFTKCEMSYRTGRYSTTEAMVECSKVDAVKARYPEVNWKVTEVQFVEVAYATPSGKPMVTSARMGKLELANARIGEVIPILQSPSDPKTITGPANRGMIGMLIIVFLRRGLTMAFIQTDVQSVFVGLILIGSVALNRSLRTEAGRWWRRVRRMGGASPLEEKKVG